MSLLGGLTFREFYQQADMITGVRPGWTPEKLGGLTVDDFLTVQETIGDNQPTVVKLQGRIF